MKKDIKDYLHLYPGCEIVVTKDGSQYFDSVEAIVFGESANLKHSGDYYFDGENDFEIQLYLRPLSDMTEEEAIELAKLSEWEPHFRDVKVYRNKIDNDIIVSWDGMAETREEFNATGELFYCSDQFQWLLKKGFDLFELIFYGLAIDKTKKKTQ